MRLLWVVLFSVFLFSFKLDADETGRLRDNFEVEYLKRMVFVSPGYRGPVEESPGVYFYGLEVPRSKKLFETLNPFLNRSFDFETLTKIRLLVQKHYEESGFPITGILLPANQDVSTGEVKYILIIGRVGEVHAEGARYFSDEAIAAQFRMKRNEQIRSQKVYEQMDWINQTPFRRTDLIYSEGKNFGETDITLRTKDRFPVRVFGGYENTGNLFAGHSRFFAGIEIANLWRLDDRFNYLFITASPLRSWYAQTASYMLAISSLKHILEFYGAYVRSKPSMDEGMDLRGKEWEVAGRYNIPFYLGYWRNNVYLGYEFKRTNNFLTFSTELIFDNFFDISQFLIGYDLFGKYSFGTTQTGIALYISPGNMTAYNHTSDFMRERQGAKSSYVYGKFHLEQNFFLPGNFTWAILSEAQLSNRKLLPTEEFVLGGFATVRGYDENEVISDNGFLLKNELRYLALSRRYKFSQEIQFLIFVDFGIAADADQNILTSNSTILASVGPGLRYNAGDHILLRFDYGWQLKTINRLEDDSKSHSRGHLSVTASF